jgi:undecaprenyl-diphosphatase
MLSADSALPLRHALALGLLQGPTELLPVSSSGHTALLPWLAGWPYGELDPRGRKSFEVALHAGAGAALAIVMRRELAGLIVGLDRRRAMVIALSLLPPAIVGLALGETIERDLGGPGSIATGLVAGAVAMVLADSRGAGRGRASRDADARDGLALGLAQAAALVPGVSRNGATLTAARARGFGRDAARELSWDAALPVIVGASALQGRRLLRRGVRRDARAALLVGASAAFASTLASARLIGPRGGRQASLLPFALYRCALAAVAFLRLPGAQARR